VIAALRSFQSIAGDAHDRQELAAEVEKRTKGRRAGTALAQAIARDASRAVARARREAGVLIGKIEDADLHLPR
jgi:hypothetical protein